jgi:hypothetical protein
LQGNVIRFGGPVKRENGGAKMAAFCALLSGPDLIMMRPALHVKHRLPT